MLYKGCLPRGKHSRPTPRLVHVILYLSIYLFNYLFIFLVYILFTSDSSSFAVVS